MIQGLRTLATDSRVTQYLLQGGRIEPAVPEASLDRLAGTETPVADFQEAADQLGVRADEEMEKSDDLRNAVHELEDSYESIVEQMTGGIVDADGSDDLPSPDELLADVERFLQGEANDKT